MRTTINIDDALLKEVKAVALATDRTMAQVVEDALRESLARRKANDGIEFRLTVSDGQGGLLPGVDIYNSAALWEILDQDDPDRRQHTA